MKTCKFVFGFIAILVMVTMTICQDQRNIYDGTCKVVKDDVSTKSQFDPTLVSAYFKTKSIHDK